MNSHINFPHFFPSCIQLITSNLWFLTPMSGFHFHTRWGIPHSWMVYFMKHLIKMDNLGAPLLKETSMWKFPISVAELLSRNCSFSPWLRSWPPNHHLSTAWIPNMKIKIWFSCLKNQKKKLEKSYRFTDWAFQPCILMFSSALICDLKQPVGIWAKEMNVIGCKASKIWDKTKKNT